MRLFTIVFTLFLSFNFVIAQHDISGSVINYNGEPLIQASVFFVDTYYAAITDDNGEFRIEDVKPGTYILKVSYVGYKSFEEEIEIFSNLRKEVNLGKNLLELGAIEISTNRIENDAVFAHSNITKEDIADENVGVDVPYVLRWTPSAVVTSDAGAGIGYTGIRLRGSDASSINVTINDIPLNDSESQSVFWVNMPDFLGSVNSIQIQRGVGTSTSGAGAFGGSVSLNTNKIQQNAYIHLNSSYGSFNTRKVGLSLGTGLLNNKYLIDARYSVIKSDGYIDRASSDLKSWFFSAARLGDRSSFRLIAFSGKERTYQAWNGAPESKVNGTDSDVQDYYDRNSFAFSKADSINLFNSGRTYNYYTYESQVDDYRQDHYQLHYTLSPNPNFKIKSTAHYTRGIGFFEEFKADEDYFLYGLNDSIQSGNLVRKRWLDNDFYGLKLSMEYSPEDNFTLQAGAHLSRYKGDHYGNVKMAEGINNLNTVKNYYEGFGEKSEGNAFLKANYSLNKFSLFGDIQFRKINYDISGVDNDLSALDISNEYNFLNPKAGISYHINQNQNVYFSYAVANKEPKRADLIDNRDQDIEHETLQDFELGYRYNKGKFGLEWNNYFMLYDNQLVLTGDVNDSGDFKKTNVGKSSRLGTEISVTTSILKNLFWNFNTTLSQNKVEEFVEDLGLEEPNIYNNTNISFSPSVIAANSFLYKPRDQFDIELTTKYVGKQYLDNTSNDNRSLDAYTVSNLRLGYNWDPSFMGSVKFNAMIYNLLDAKYSSNGYTYSYYSSDDLITENFLYPQAGIHFMIGANIKL